MNAAEHIKANKLLQFQVARGNPLICPLLGKAGVTFPAES